MVHRSESRASGAHMRPVLLILLLAACAVLAVYPSFVWSLAWAFDSIDDRWRLVLGHSVFTVPLSFALAAVVLTIHGLRLNADFQEEAVEEFSDLRERELAAVAAAAGAGGAAAGSAAAEGGAEDGGVAVAQGATVSASDAPRETKTARTGGNPRKTASKGDRMKRRAKSMANRQVRRRMRF